MAPKVNLTFDLDLKKKIKKINNKIFFFKLKNN